jgi:site-specific DNA-methyltransferase (cytosine-N4-specific)
MLESYANDPLIQSLQEVERRNGSEFWSFQRSAPRRGAHALLHYPAMMVPELQGTILQSIREAAPATASVLDPFAGSGTVLVESMQLGLNFCGVDINPLAGLACLAKAGPYYIDAFDHKRKAIIAAIKGDRTTYIPREFFGRDKWFATEVAAELEKIHQHIRAERSLWARRLFWLALCRVVRSTSNSRMSTYKLHQKPAEGLNVRHEPTSIFAKSLALFGESLSYQRDVLHRSGLIDKGRYQGDLEIQVSDNSILSKTAFRRRTFDVVMTSPPYGDNRTTIPYGQFAYLPLHWVDLADIQPGIDSSLLANTHATDSASLGGSLRSAHTKLEELTDTSVNARQFLQQIKDDPFGRKRFGAFFFDFRKAVERISLCTAADGYQVWTTGNRRIAGKEVPMDDLLSEILENNGIDVLGKIKRGIHFKKMASRNRLTDTMTAETIMLGRKRHAT